ncbi:MAG: Mur ligase domain-containing protein, partial [Thermacetogeniaceae bacterium]
MRLIDLLQGIKILEGRGLEQTVEGVHYDSRQIKKGYIVVCVKGYRTDGHLYIDDAVSRGAVGVVVERAVDVPEGISLVRVEDSR